MTYWFLIPLLLGFALNWASAFTTAYSRLWGDKVGQMTTVVLRNFLGIPLWFLGFVLASLRPAPLLFGTTTASQVLGWLLIVVGAVPVLWGHLTLRMATHMPSVHDSLVRHGVYAHLRHPIYAGLLPIFVGLAVLRPTSAFLLACAFGFMWAVIQAKLEEFDLVQRMADYKAYMARVRAALAS